MRQYGLIGFPLTHSFSEKYFSEKFAREGIHDASYQLYPIENISGLPGLLAGNADIRGLNVTIPYKETVIPYLDELSGEAKEIGAVNCIKINGAVKTGYNTDAFGFHQSIKPFLEPQHDRALILGTGGAAKAVAYVLKKIGIPFLFASRQPSGQNEVAYAQLNELLVMHHRLVINTTPVGTFPGIEDSPAVPYEFFTPKHFVIDLVYNPSETLFLKQAKAHGAMIMNGESMLKQQAERSWELWNAPG